MRSVAPMRIAKVGSMVSSAALCLLGILLIAVPAFSASLFGGICGGILILFGIVKLVGYFSKDLYRLAFQYDLAFGLMMIALGVIMLVHPGGFLNFLCIALGLSILTDGLLKIQIAIDSKRFGICKWWLIMGFAIIACLFGSVLMFQPSFGSRVITVLIGAALLAEGILNFSTMVTAVKIIKHQQPDIIEVDFYDEREDK